MSIALNVSHTLSLPARAMATSAETRPQASATMHSAELLRGQKAVEIVHNGSTYRLQATRLGKLILTK
jgi:hemin uptake protein HemP